MNITEGPGSDFLHRQIAEEIVARIKAGTYPPGSRLPSERILAMEFGATRGTVRQALAALQSDSRIESVPARGHFVRSGRPAKPDSRRRLIGVVVPSVAKPYVSEILVGLEDELHHRGYAMVIGSSGATREQQAGRVERLLDEGASGLVVYPIDYEPDHSLFTLLRDGGLPVVLIDRYLLGQSFDAVISDNAGGAYAAVSHLIAGGHRRIAFVSTDNLKTSSVAERLQGYLQALVDKGITPDRNLRFEGLKVTRAWPRPELPSVKDGRRIATFLEKQKPTAVFALHDHIAVDVMAAAELIGMRVPDQLAVVGFDDDPFARALAVPLTTVSQPRERTGRVAARLIVERIEGARHEVERVVLPTELVIRRSSSKLRTQSNIEPAVAEAG